MPWIFQWEHSNLNLPKFSTFYSKNHQRKLNSSSYEEITQPQKTPNRHELVNQLPLNQQEGNFKAWKRKSLEL